MERILEFQVQDGKRMPGRFVRERIGQVVRALRDQGIINKEDEIVVNLVSNPALPAGLIGCLITVEDIYSNIAGGSIDPAKTTYRVDFS